MIEDNTPDFEPGDEDIDDEISPFESFAPPIPTVLHSVFEDGPFKACVDCSRPLNDIDAPYVIQKVYRDGDVVMEFALCLECMDGMNSEMSEESRLAMEAHIAELSFLVVSTDQCNLCGDEHESSRGEYAVFGLARGTAMMSPAQRVCSPCAESMESVLSETTRKGFEDFTTRNFPGIPADIDLPIAFLPH